MKQERDLAGICALAANILCWGSVPVFLRELTSSIDAWTCNGFRYPFAAVLYWPILVVAYRAGTFDRGLIVRALVPAILALLTQILWALAPYYLPAGMIAFLVRTAVVWSLLAAMFLFADERALLKQPRFYAGLLLASAGFVCLSSARGAYSDAVTGKGVLIALGCSFFSGMYGISVRLFMRDVPPLFAFGVVAQYVSVGTITLMLLFGQPTVLFELSGRAWSYMICSSILGIALAHVLFYAALQRLGASVATSGQLLTPFVTIALAWFALGEAMGPADWLAGAMIVVGAGLLTAMPAPRFATG